MGAVAAAPAAPLLALGPPGWLAYGVIVVGGGVLAYLVYDEITEDDAPAVPRTEADTDTQTRKCDRPWSVRVHAQGIECGGTTGSTIGAPPLVNLQRPITKIEGIALSNATFALLTRRQRKLRLLAKARLERHINRSSFLGKISFTVKGATGGERYDVDSFGCTPNFVV